jgi:hypothetical protein
VEKGTIQRQENGFVPYEHIQYAEKGVTAITITTREEPFSNAFAKFSVFDRDFDITSLEPSLIAISEALAETLLI